METFNIYRQSINQFIKIVQLHTDKIENNFLTQEIHEDKSNTSSGILHLPDLVTIFIFCDYFNTFRVS